MNRFVSILQIKLSSFHFRTGVNAPERCCYDPTRRFQGCAEQKIMLKTVTSFLHDHWIDTTKIAFVTKYDSSKHGRTRKCYDRVSCHCHRIAIGCETQS